MYNAWIQTQNVGHRDLSQERLLKETFHAKMLHSDRKRVWTSII